MIPSGYKQTEIGVIPEDWGVIPFSKCFDTINNNTLSRAELNYDGGNIRNIHYGDVLINFPSIVDCQKETIPYVNKDAADSAGNSFLQDGDVVIADTAEDNTVGKAVEIFNIGDSKVVAGLHTMPCRPKNKFAEKYLGYYINARVFHDQIIPFITGTKVSSISKKAIDDTTVLVPPLAEQKRIAETLSDVDELIASLEKLIEKKKALKQGVMQELLTGKRRLPGFTGEWVEISFESIYSYAKEGGTPSTSNELYYKNGGIPFIKIEDLAMKYIDTGTTYITNEGIEHSSAWIIPANSVILSNGATIGEVSINRIPVATKQGILGIIPDVSIDIEFLYYLFSTTRFRDDVKRITTHGTMDCAYLKDLNTIRLFIPSDKNEQIKISSILSDFDNEIVVKERELQKYRRLKFGMMSELLTGRIRLV